MPIGATAVDGDVTLRTFRVGSLPLINHFLERLELEDVLDGYLPADDVRQEIPTKRIVLLLVRNVLISRKPMYAVPEWAAQYGPELLDLYHVDIPLLHDDRLGKCLARLYTATTPDLILAVVRQAIRVFQVSLDELHNDSTTCSFYGNYFQAADPLPCGNRMRPAITWGNSKDHRPDLKQLLFTLTVANDGGVPLYFTVDSGNTTDDTTHQATWDLLVELVGSSDFLYVADCKLASRKNMQHIAARGGRFITVLPASRREDGEFRRRLRESPDAVIWRNCWKREDDTRVVDGDQDEPPVVVDVIRVCDQEQVTSDGFRLIWFHSHRKAELDELARSKRVGRAIKELEQLQMRLASPRTRFREEEKVRQATEAILAERKVEGLLDVKIKETQEAAFRQQGRGRPSAKTKYHRELKSRFELTWSIDNQRWRHDRLDDGIFPLLTNDRSMSPREVLEAYKRQPKIEKRFAQLKSDFDIAPVFLKTPERVLGLFTVYFLALLVQSLIERQLRNALQDATPEDMDDPDEDPHAIDIYPERRRTRRPTARKVIDALEPLHRYEIHRQKPGHQEPQNLSDSLNDTQCRLLRLLRINPNTYGR
jgi:transposase